MSFWQQRTQYLFQAFRIVVDPHDNTLWIEQKGGGNGLDIELPGQSAIKILGLHRMVGPGQFILLDRPLPGRCILLDADTEYFEATVMVALVKLYQVRIFGTAGAAPAAPELKQHVLAA